MFLEKNLPLIRFIDVSIFWHNSTEYTIDQEKVPNTLWMTKKYCCRLPTPKTISLDKFQYFKDFTDDGDEDD